MGDLISVRQIDPAEFAKAVVTIARALVDAKVPNNLVRRLQELERPALLGEDAKALAMRVEALERILTAMDKT